MPGAYLLRHKPADKEKTCEPRWNIMEGPDDGGELECDRIKVPNVVKALKQKLGGTRSNSKADLGEGKIPKDAREYDMNHRRRGRAFLFNRIDFHFPSPCSKRNGAESDSDNLTRVLSALGFAVEEHVDKKIGEIESILTVVQRDDHSDADCLLVVMMTHGDEEGFLYDSQSWKFEAKKLWAPFTPDLCPTLAGKPKLFLVQACQGDQTDGVVKMSSNKSGGFSSYQLPNHADFLIATSTILGKSSLRNTLTGSYFISAVCKVLGEEFFPFLYFLQGAGGGGLLRGPALHPDRGFKAGCDRETSGVI